MIVIAPFNARFWRNWNDCYNNDDDDMCRRSIYDLDIFKSGIILHWSFIASLNNFNGVHKINFRDISFREMNSKVFEETFVQLGTEFHFGCDFKNLSMFLFRKFWVRIACLIAGCGFFQAIKNTPIFNLLLIISEPLFPTIKLVSFKVFIKHARF